MELIACVGDDKTAWGQITGLINRGAWDKIILVRTQEGIVYNAPQHAEEVNIDSKKPVVELKKDLMLLLKGKLSEFEVCLSIASGTGKEHMALISALLSIPVGIRLVAFTKQGVEFIN